MTASSFQRNQLVNSSSPYLRQHADNPVNWQIWSAEVLAEAQRLDKPILLSIGYAACHWCHVMAHESFADEATASAMNRLFINIKVDREERPDIDQIYMAALHAMGEQGGWPLTMFLTPEAVPYWGGTYFPPQSAHGRPAFNQVLEALARTYRENPDTIAKNSNAIRNHLNTLSKSPDPKSEVPDESLSGDFAKRTLSLFNPVHGGMRGAPKFPNAPILETWARAAGGNPETAAGRAFLKTVTQISQGGIYDHLRGGIARYSVDEQWLVPHFEKMLYDNAHYIRHLVMAWKMTRQPLFRQRIEETINWLDAEMKLGGGAYAASLDADSEGEEGSFYVWSKEEIKKLAGKNFELFAGVYDVQTSGNWEDKTILNLLKNVPTTTKTETTLSGVKKLLLAERNKRIRPDLDDKVLTDWNGYLIRALAEAGSAFARPEWLKAAQAAFHCIAESNSIDGDLVHSWRDRIYIKPALATDYGAMMNAALSLHEATGEPAYLEKVKHWLEILQSNYSDGAGGFYLTSSSTNDLPVRPRCDLDEANPSGASQVLEAMIRYRHLAGSQQTLAAAEALVINQQAVSKTSPHGMAGFMNALHSWFDHRHIMIIAKTKKSAKSLINAAKLNPVVALTISIKTGTALQAHLGMSVQPLQEKPMAFVCSSQACSAPITSASELTAQLNKTS